MCFSPCLKHLEDIILFRLRFSLSLVTADITKSDDAKLSTMRFLDTTGSRFASGFDGQFLRWSLASGKPPSRSFGTRDDAAMSASKVVLNEFYK